MFDFDEVVDRKGTNCAKWDTIEANNKPKDVLPMWVADILNHQRKLKML